MSEHITIDAARRLIRLAYEDGWSDACRDHTKQRLEPGHPIGDSKRLQVDEILYRIDPRDVLGARGVS